MVISKGRTVSMSVTYARQGAENSYFWDLCTTCTSLKPLSHYTAFPWRCLIFQSAMREQAKSDIFFQDRNVTASSLRTRCCHEAPMVCFHVPTEFLLATACAPATLPLLALCFHDAHCANDVLKITCKCGRDAVKMSCNRTVTSLRSAFFLDIVGSQP